MMRRDPEKEPGTFYRHLLLKLVILGLHLDVAARALGFLADLHMLTVDGVLEGQFRAAKTAGVLVLDDRLMLGFVARVVLPLIH